MVSYSRTTTATGGITTRPRAGGRSGVCKGQAGGRSSGGDAENDENDNDHYDSRASLLSSEHQPLHQSGRWRTDSRRGERQVGLGRERGERSWADVEDHSEASGRQQEKSRQAESLRRALLPTELVGQVPRSVWQEDRTGWGQPVRRWRKAAFPIPRCWQEEGEDHFKFEKL